MRNDRKRQLSVLGVVGAMVLSGGAAARADVVANFDGGAGTSLPDSYTGTAGAGWQGAWATSTTGGVSASSSIQSSNPLAPGGGNYVSVAMSATAFNNGGNQGVIYRKYGGAGTDVDLTRPMTVSLLFRADSFSGTGVRFFLFDSNGVTTGTGPGNSWQLNISGTGSGWAITNGNQVDGGGVDVGTGIPLVAGRTVALSLDIDPATRTFVVHLDDGVNPAYTSATMKFRILSSSLGGYLNFGARYDWGTSAGDVNGSQKDWAFSVDSVRIAAAVPEPASLAGGLAVVGAAAMVRRRRRG